jgi:hypothetical protein
MTADQLLNALFNAGIAISVGATVLSLGMTYTPAQLLAPLKRVWLVVAVVGVNAAAIPAIAWLVAEALPISDVYVSGLVLATLGAGSAAALKGAQLAERADLPLAVSLVVVLQLSNIVAVPLWAGRVVSGALSQRLGHPQEPAGAGAHPAGGGPAGAGPLPRARPGLDGEPCQGRQSGAGHRARGRHRRQLGRDRRDVRLLGPRRKPHHHRGGRATGSPRRRSRRPHAHHHRPAVGSAVRFVGPDHHRHPTRRQPRLPRPAITFALLDFVLPLVLAIEVGRKVKRHARTPRSRDIAQP